MTAVAKELVVVPGACTGIGATTVSSPRASLELEDVARRHRPDTRERCVEVKNQGLSACRQSAVERSVSTKRDGHSLTVIRVRAR